MRPRGHGNRIKITRLKRVEVAYHVPKVWYRRAVCWLLRRPTSVPVVMLRCVNLDTGETVAMVSGPVVEFHTDGLPMVPDGLTYTRYPADISAGSRIGDFSG